MECEKPYELLEVQLTMERASHQVEQAMLTKTTNQAIAAEARVNKLEAELKATCRWAQMLERMVDTEVHQTAEVHVEFDESFTNLETP